jgi:hypothetical protein
LTGADDPAGAAAPGRTGRFGEAAWYGLALALVAAFVNTFEIWIWLQRQLPPWALTGVPFALTAPLIAWVGWRLRAHAVLARSWPWFAAAAAAAAVAFAITDPAFPAKRAHIPEYMLLALVLRRGLAYHHAGAYLSVMSGIAAAVLGVHDELLQGLHPTRYFGLADIVVNAISAGAGACLGHGLATAADGDARPRSAIGGVGVPGWAVAAAAIAGLALLVLVLLRMPGQPMPPWAALPVLAAVACWLLLEAGRGRAPGAGRAVTIVVWLSAAAILEPMIANVTTLDFR